MKHFKKRAYVLDIGSVSVRLMISGLTPDGKTEVIHESSRVTRLLEGISEDGYLNHDSMERTIQAMESFLSQCELPLLGGCLGTQALRTAGNAVEFQREVRSRTGLEIKILSTQEEGQYALAGSEDLMTRQDFLIDMGGGSTEIISISSEDQGVVVFSVDLGAAAPRVFFDYNVGVTESAFLDYQNRISCICRDCFQPVIHMQPERLIFLGGTATTAAAILLKMVRYRSGCVHGMVIPVHKVDELILQSAFSDVGSLESWRGMESGRSSIFLPGLVILSEICRLWKKKEFTVSELGIRHGFMRQLLK